MKITVEVEVEIPDIENCRGCRFRERHLYSCELFNERIPLMNPCMPCLKAREER